MNLYEPLHIVLCDTGLRRQSLISNQFPFCNLFLFSMIKTTHSTFFRSVTPLSFRQSPQITSYLSQKNFDSVLITRLILLKRLIRTYRRWPTDLPPLHASIHSCRPQPLVCHALPLFTAACLSADRRRPVCHTISPYIPIYAPAGYAPITCALRHAYSAPMLLYHPNITAVY